MKKRFQSRKQKRHQAQRARKEARHRKRSAREKQEQIFRQGHVPRHKRPKRQKWRIVAAPAHFSFIHNTEEVIQFFQQVRRAFGQGRNVTFDLSGVTILTPETVAVFLSKLDDPRFTKDQNFRGNVPADPQCRQVLMDAGFFEHVWSLKGKPQRKGVGEIFRRRDVKVEAEEAHRLRKKAFAVVPGSLAHADGTEAVIIDCMSNTENHAGLGKSTEKWYLSIYCDKASNRAYFTFVDNGFGILNTLQRDGRLQQVVRFLSLKDNAAVLRSMLEDEVRKSRMPIKHRGHGLPNMARRLKMAHISNLILISNDVYANVADGIYRTMGESFHGTFVYWEHRGA